MPDSAVPKRIYKYQAFTTQALTNLTSRQIWFSKPERFNDPFDCALKVWKLRLSDGELEHLYRRYKAKLPEPNDWDARYLTQGHPNERFRDDIERGLQGAEEDRSGAIRRRGVCCFSEKNEDLLMWGHYADGHRGFCLEFDTALEPFSQLHRVHYRSELPSVDTVKLLDDPHSSNVLDAMVLTKSDRWAYEKEWRLLHMDGDRQYTYGWKALTGIYLGAAMPEDHREVICLILRGAPTRLHQMVLKQDQFSVTCREFTYTPFSYV